MPYTFIVNPVAGHGRAGRRLRRLEAAAKRAGLDYRIAVTERPAQAADLAHEAAQDRRTVVAVGGDGTVHEVARGLIRSGHSVPLGLIPVGTGNDFATCLSVPRSLEAAVAALRHATPVAIDYGMLRWQEAHSSTEHATPFVNAMGAGLDACIADAASGGKLLPGVAAYLSVLPRVLHRWASPHVRIVSPESSVLYSGRLLLFTVGNGTTSGGGFRLTPRASVADGLLDVCVVEQLTTVRIVQLLPRALRGRHETAPEVHTARVTAVHMDAGQAVAVHADGEVVTRAAVHLDVTVVPKGLTVLLPSIPFETLGPSLNS